MLYNYNCNYNTETVNYNYLFLLYHLLRQHYSEYPVTLCTKSVSNDGGNVVFGVFLIKVCKVYQIRAAPVNINKLYDSHLTLTQNVEITFSKVYEVRILLFQTK